MSKFPDLIYRKIIVLIYKGSIQYCQASSSLKQINKRETRQSNKTCQLKKHLIHEGKQNLKVL